MKLEENCELRGTDNVQGQISEHIFAPNGGYCLYYPSNLLRNARSFENWEIFLDIPQFQPGDIRSGDVFRPIARERKDVMDYKYRNLELTNQLCNISIPLFLDDVDDFIVDDEGNPINKHSKKKRRLLGTVQDL